MLRRYGSELCALRRIFTLERRPQRVAREAAAVAIALLALALLASPSHGAISLPTPVGCPGAFGTFSTDALNLPPPCWHPYGPRSVFNEPIPAHPRLARGSRSIVRYMVDDRWTFSGEGSRLAMYASPGRPVYWSTPSDPLIRVMCRGGHSCRRGMMVRIPPGAVPSEGSDAQMVIVDQAAGREYDFWQATVPRDGVMWVSAGNSLPIGADRGTGLHSFADAAYLGLLGGMIRVPELRAGTIDHALAMVVPCVQYHDVWPSPRHGHGDSTCPGGGGPHFGSLLQLNMSERQIDATHAPRWQKAIMRALHTYGAYVVDTDGSAGQSIRWISLVTENDSPISAALPRFSMRTFVRQLGGSTMVLGARINLRRFRVIAPCVAHRRCA